MEEVSAQSKVCLYNGSTRVDETFEALLDKHLQDEHPLTKVSPKHIERAMEMFRTIKKPEFSNLRKATGFWEISDDEDDYEDGGIEIPWSVPALRQRKPPFNIENSSTPYPSDRTLIEAAFKPHVDLVVEAISTIAQRDKPKVSIGSGNSGWEYLANL